MKKYTKMGAKVLDKREVLFYNIFILNFKNDKKMTSPNGLCRYNLGFLDVLKKKEVKEEVWKI